MRMKVKESNLYNAFLTHCLSPLSCYKIVLVSADKLPLRFLYFDGKRKLMGFGNP